MSEKRVIIIDDENLYDVGRRASEYVENGYVPLGPAMPTTFQDKAWWCITLWLPPESSDK